MDQATFIRNSAAAQGIIKLAKPSLVVDGWFGTYTKRAYDQLSLNDKSGVDATLRALGTSADELFETSRLLKDPGRDADGGDNARWLSEVEAYALVKRACLLFNRPDLEGVLSPFVKLESVQRRAQDGRLFFDTRSGERGLYKGLMQMGEPAWVDAMARLSKIGYPLDPFRKGWADPKQNITAGVAYAIVNIEKMTRDRIPVTTATVYTAHNQGYGGLKTYLRTGSLMYPDQSRPALQLMAQSRKDAKSSAFV